MRLTRIAFGIALMTPCCAPLIAQDTQPDVQLVKPPGATPKPFDWSRFKLLVAPPKTANPPVILNAPKPLVLTPNKLNRPCSEVRIMRPRPSRDQNIAPGNPTSGPPVEANSKDITEMNVPAPSCLDFGRAGGPKLADSE